MASQLGELFVSISADVSNVLKGIGDTDKALGNLGNNLQSIGSSFTSFGTTLSLAVTAPLAAIGVGSVKTAMDFDTSMRKVQAVTGITGDSFNALSDFAIKLGADTAFSSSEAADAILQLGQAGFTIDEIYTSTNDVLSLASAGTLDLGTAAEITSNAMNGFGLNAGDTAHIVDVLAMGASISTTNVQGLGEALSYVAPAAHSMGMSIEETTSLIAALSNAGIEGSRAGTTLAGSINALATPTDQMIAIFGKYNIALDSVNPATSSFTDILQVLIDKGVTSADVMALFGREAGPGVLALLSQGTGAIREQTLALQNSQGAAQKAAEIMESGANGAWHTFTGSVEALMIQIGRLILEALVPLMGHLTNLVNWVGQLPAPVLLAAVAFGAIVAAIGPLLVIIGTLISSVGVISTALGAAGLSGALATVVGILTGPVAIAIAAFIAAAYLIYRNWETIGPIVKEAFDIILAAIQPVANRITEFVTGALASLSAWWATNGPAISQAATRLFNLVAPVFEVLSTVILGFVYGALVVLWEAFSIAVNIIIPLAEGLGTQIGNVIMLVVNLINGDWNAAWQNAVNIVQNTWNLIVSIFNGQLLSNAVKGVWDNVLAIISETLDFIIALITGKTGEAATSLKNGMVNAGAEMINGTIGWIPGVSGVVDGMVSKLTEVPTGASQSMQAFGPAVTGPIDATAVQAAAHTGTLVTGVVGQVSTLPSRTTTALNPFTPAVVGPIDTASVQAAARAGTLVTGTVSQVAQVVPRTTSAMSGFVPAVVNPVNAAVSPATSAATRVGTGATSGLSSGMSPMPSNAASTMNGVAASIRNSGSTLASAATSAGQAAVGALNSQLSRVQYTASQIRSAVSEYNILTGQLRSTSSSSSSGSSSSSTGIKRQGSDGTGESRVRIVEAHATGGIAGYTGMHWMEKGEIAVPEQTDWSKVLAGPMKAAMSGILASSGNVTNSYGGDTIVIESVTLSNDYDFDQLMARIEATQQKKRLQRGYTL